MIELLGGALHLLAEVGDKIGDTIPDEQLQAGDTLEVRFEVRPFDHSLLHLRLHRAQQRRLCIICSSRGGILKNPGAFKAVETEGLACLGGC